VKLKLYFLLTVVIFLNACSNRSSSYQLVSEMNTLHPIEIIYIDDKTRKMHDAQPFERRFHAKVIDSIQKDQPAAIILKFFFDKDYPDTLQDRVLRESLDKYNNVLTQTTAVLPPVYEADFSEIKKHSLKHTISKHTEDKTTQNHAIDQLVNNDTLLLPNKTLLDGFSGIGSVDISIDQNKQLLSIPALTKAYGELIPNLSLVTVATVLNQAIELKDGVISIQDQKIPLDRHLNLPLDLSEPRSLYKTHSYLDALNNKVGNMKDKIVIIYVDDPAVRYVKSDYEAPHNNAEIIADSINTLLKLMQ